MREIIQAYVDAHEDSSSLLQLRSEEACVSQDLRAELTELRKEVESLRQEKRRKDGDIHDLKLLSADELDSLEGEVETSLCSIRKRQKQLYREKMNETFRKEEELRKENEKLRKQVEELQCARWEICCAQGFEASATSMCTSHGMTSERSDSFLDLRLN
ncbi:hypothetical protein KP509_15G037400 [Ceratopteris richardii]|uniref:K-box domain-containing protein n=2 Tax=Ceratopteris richardii TaxID=49495 RepID=A0A8T2T8K3_CERRI|nr:hypothetical protein KP509_15G037400 [Ceratopteris richardii]